MFTMPIKCLRVYLFIYMLKLFFFVILEIRFEFLFSYHISIFCGEEIVVFANLSMVYVYESEFFKK